VVRVPGYTTEMYCVSCEVRTEFIYVMYKKVERLCGLMVRVAGYRSRGPELFPGLPDFLRSSDSGLENREYGSRDPSRYPRYPQKLMLTSPTSSGRSVGIVRSRTQATELVIRLTFPNFHFKIFKFTKQTQF
jgi:hypothetical protein